MKTQIIKLWNLLKSPTIKHWKNVALVILIVFLVVSVKIKNNKINNLISENNIANTLLDTVTTYKNKLNELTYEKQAFNVKFSDLKNSYDKLDQSNKDFIDRIRILENENKKLIAATSISQIVEVDPIIDTTAIIDTVNNTLQFKDVVLNVDKDTLLKYDFLINTLSPKLTIQELSMPNILYISHKFNSDNTGVLVDVTNSNDYFKVNDINSYVIPIDKKSHIKTYIKVGGISFAIGITGALILLN